MSNGFLSKRVKRRDQSGITSDRYEFLGLDQAEPDLGDPIVGPSSVSANPFTGSVTNLYFVASDGNGKRYWTKQTDVVAGGVVTPGSITVRDEGVIVGGVNQVTDINFVGSGVTITSPASWVGAGASSVDIQIVVTDVAADGNIGNIQFKGSDGFIQGSNDLYYNTSTQRVGVGSTLPTQKLDVLGNVVVSGIITANELSANTFSVSNFTIDENGLIFNVGSSGVGIGTSLPKATLDVLGTANVTGVLTATRLSTPQLNATNINVTGVTTSNSYYVNANEVISSARQLKNINSLDAVTTATIESAIANAPNDFTSLNVTGIATIQTLNATNTNIIGVATVGLVTASNAFVSGIGTINTLNSTTATVGFLSATNVFVATAATVGVLTATTSIANRIQANSIGIGTTNPRQNLDVIGNIRLSGTFYDYSGSSGTPGQVLISNGTNPVAWGNPSEVAAGSATSVTTLDKNGISTSYYVTFVEKTSGNQSIFLDSNNLTYNPSTNTLSVDSINTKNIEVEGLSRVTTGVVTTSNKNEVVIDTLNTTLYRSARYNIQVNTLGQLTLDSNRSVTGLNSGRNYFPGVYSNILLNNIVGTGTDARANITVSPEATLPITGSLNGVFTTSGSLVGIGTSQSVIFTQVIAPSNYENSRVTDITITSAGSGYTSIPTFTFDSPIIVGNPVEGVGVGSTATGVVSSMKVSNLLFTNSGFITSIVPTVTISPPTSGTQATANVGYGVSTITVTGNGIGYISIPSVVFGGSFATAGVSTIFVNKLRVNDPGYGYTTGDLGATIIFSAGSAAATNNSFSLPNSHLGFNISNPGTGYTTPPVLTVSSPQIGINTGLAEATLGIATFTVTSPGSGYTVSPTISNSPSVTGFAATVGLGVSNLGIQISGGSNYTGAPTITFNPVGGIGTGAQGSFTSINPDPPNNLEGFVITNPGFGYTVPPTVTVSGGGGVGAAVTIRTMIVRNVSINNIGYGATVVPTSTLSTNPIEFLDFAITRTGSVGIATTSRVDDVIFSAQGTLGTASTTVITGISTFATVIRQKTGNVDAINDSTITGIDTSNVSVGFAVTGTFVQAGTTVSLVNSNDGGTIGLTQNLTNPSVGFGLTFFVSDTLSSRVIVGQGVSGTSINQTEYGTTVISIGSSTVTLSRAATNSGVQTNTFSFGTLVTIPGTFQTTLITGITTAGISTGQRVVSTITSENTNVSSIGISSIVLTQNTTNIAVATTSFNFFTVTPAAGDGASISPSMGIGRVTVGIDTSQPLNLGFGTGYTALPGIAVTAADGTTGGGGIVTTSSFGIDTDCIRITNPGIYTSIPSVLINSPGIGGGSAATANVGIGISTINVTSAGSYTGTKPTISFSGGSPLVSAAATVTNIILNNVTLVNAGSGYTSANIPVLATFSNVSLGATVGLSVENVTLTSPGLGYTVTPNITFSSSIFGFNASATATLANFGPEFNLLPGPGYGNTFVYYIEPVTSNTFRLYRNISRTNQITVGFSTIGNPNALVGGRISNVSINYAGSGYTSGNILSASAVSLGNTFSANVGTGFSFTATNVVQNYQISDIMMLQSVGSANTTADIVEYGGVTNLDDLIEFSSDISGSNARLKAIPKYRDNTIKITRTSIAN